MITDSQKKAIVDYIQDKPVEVMYFFGSQATGNARPDSDYDFGAIFSPESSIDSRIELMNYLSDLLKNDHVDVLDLKKVPIRFQYEAIKPGQDIFVRNSKIRNDFEYEVMRDYFDEMYYMKQTTRDYLHSRAND